MSTLKLTDTILLGRWELVGGEVIADPVARRIDYLTANVLKKIGTSVDGWSILYEDPTDHRLWELTYPQSELTAGGPPRLAVLSPADAAERYSAFGK